MPDAKLVAIIDIGKTNAKLALVDLGAMREIAVRKRPNRVLPRPPYPHYDIEALWSFILNGLKELNAERGIDAIVVTTHGASAALLDENGDLAAPVLDYEHDGPDALDCAYDAVRPDFSRTGSPRLPLGLNLGAQLFWQFKTFPEIAERTAAIVTYPQYWAFRLCGKAVNEVTSLGCHTDLWDPHERDFSPLVDTMGWRQAMAPVAKAGDRLGSITAEVAHRTGMAPSTSVICGIHDSNASLYPHIASRTPPFAVVSTGTWVICMAVGGKPAALDPARDTLINVNALGEAVPSARFMGGREFETLMDGHRHPASAEAIRSVIARGAMLLPAVEPRSGPFQGRQAAWTVDENDLSAAERHAVVSFYLALMTATCLDMTGAEGPTIIEGPFAANHAYRTMLTAATERPVAKIEGTGTCIGAAMLATGASARTQESDLPSSPPDDAMKEYAAKWRRSSSVRD